MQCCNKKSSKNVLKIVATFPDLEFNGPLDITGATNAFLNGTLSGGLPQGHVLINYGFDCCYQGIVKDGLREGWGILSRPGLQI